MGQYFDNVELESSPKVISGNITGINFDFITDNGVFSKDKIDEASIFLVENITDVKADHEVLDLGCGYGFIGTYFAKKFGVKPDLIDINTRAVELARKNLKLNKVSGNVYENNGLNS